MFKPSKYVNEICPCCHPHGYKLSLAKFTGEKNITEASNADESYIDYLYECCQCGAKVWVDDQWMNRNKIDSASMDVIRQRKKYIKRKTSKLDAITDAHKYSRRLARIMRYHRLLTQLEVAAVKKLTNGDMKMMENVVWQLPVIQSDLTDHNWIHPKAKYHAFINDISLCVKYCQDTKNFETGIEESKLMKNKELACKKCLKKLGD